MGNVIFNSELLSIARQKLKYLKILKTNIKFNVDTISPNKFLNINNKNYSFKKIVMCVGKSILSGATQKSLVFENGVYSYVGFFKHKKDHNGVAYELFNKEGPLAVLPHHLQIIKDQHLYIQQKIKLHIQKYNLL